MQLPVRAVGFSPDGRHALSASGGEPQIAVWRLEGPGSKKSQPSCGLLSLEDPAVQITSSPAPSSAPAETFQVSRAPSPGCARPAGTLHCREGFLYSTRQFTCMRLPGMAAQLPLCASPIGVDISGTVWHAGRHVGTCDCTANRLVLDSMMWFCLGGNPHPTWCRIGSCHRMDQSTAGIQGS